MKEEFIYITPIDSDFYTILADKKCRECGNDCTLSLLFDTMNLITYFACKCKNSSCGVQYITQKKHPDISELEMCYNSFINSTIEEMYRK